MTATTLAIVATPTLADGLAELLRIADAVAAADQLDCGVTLVRAREGHLSAAMPDPEVAPGVLVTEADQPERIDPWAPTHTPAAMRARRELVELLAYVTHADLVVTADQVQLLPSCASW